MILHRCALSVFLVATLYAWQVPAHPHASAERAAIEAEAQALQPRPPLDGAPAFARELLQRAAYTLETHALDHLRRAVTAYDLADGAADPLGEPSARQDRLRTLADIAFTDALTHAHTVVELDAQARDDLHRRTVPVTLPGDTGHVLLRIVHGAGPPIFRTVSVNLERLVEPDARTRLAYRPGGVTWYLLHFEKAPPGASSLSYFDLVPDAGGDAPMVYAVLNVITPVQGVLRVDLRNEQGESTAAMVRLTNLDTGAMRRPDAAVELGPQAGLISGVAGAGWSTPEAMRVPPPWGGHYWLVAGPFETALPPGNWALHCYKGVEYNGEVRRFTLTSDAVHEEAVSFTRWVDMKARGWWSGDDHVHARLTNDADAERLLAWTEAADIHVANILTMGNHMRTWYEQRGYGPEWRVQRGERVLVPGQEDPRFFLGHTIGLNITSLVRDTSRYLMNDWVADELRRQGALYGHAHMSHYQLFNGERDLTMLMPEGKSDFGVILQCLVLNTKLYYDFLNLGFPLTASSGSDTPYGSSIGEVRVYAHLGDTPFSADAWFAAFEAGHTFVSNGPMLEFTVDGEPTGTAITREENATHTIRARAWGQPDYGKPSFLHIVRNGEVIGEVTADPAAPASELTLELEVETGFGGWLAAHTEDENNGGAHTTPVYLVREGFRWWNYEKAPALIADCLATIDSMEETVRGLRAMAEAGTLQQQEFRMRPLMVAEQASEFLAWTARIRAAYEALLEVHAAEAAARRDG